MYSQEMRYDSGIGLAELKVKPSLGIGLFDEDCIVGVELRAHVELQRRSWFFSWEKLPFLFSLRRKAHGRYRVDKNAFRNGQVSVKYRFSLATSYLI